MSADSILNDPPPADVRVLSARGGSLAQHLDPAAMFRRLWRHRAIIGRFTRTEIVGRYRGSQLGLLWSFINPLALLAIYTVVFGIVLPSHWPHRETGGMGEFALILFSGLIPFGLFGESATRAPHLILSVPSFVKKTVFALEILPVSLVLSALFHAGASLAILLCAELIILGRIPPTALLLPIVALPLLLLALGVTWLLASLGMFLRDIGNTVGIAVQALFFATPIFYSPESVPEGLRPLLALNPLTSVVTNFRRVLLWNLGPIWSEWLLWSAVTACLAALGFAWFMKTRRSFADVL